MRRCWVLNKWVGGQRTETKRYKSSKYTWEFHGTSCYKSSLAMAAGSHWLGSLKHTENERVPGLCSCVAENGLTVGS